LIKTSAASDRVLRNQRLYRFAMKKLGGSVRLCTS